MCPRGRLGSEPIDENRNVRSRLLVGATRDGRRERDPQVRKVMNSAGHEAARFDHAYGDGIWLEPEPSTWMDHAPPVSTCWCEFRIERVRTITHRTERCHAASNADLRTKDPVTIRACRSGTDNRWLTSTGALTFPEERRRFVQQQSHPMTMVQQSQCPIVFRVVGRLPRSIGTSTRPDARGQASYKPQGRKPRSAPTWSEPFTAMAIRSVPLKARRIKTRANQSLGNRDRISDAAGHCYMPDRPAPDCLRGVVGASVPYELSLPKSRQLTCAS